MPTKYRAQVKMTVTAKPHVPHEAATLTATASSDAVDNRAKPAGPRPLCAVTRPTMQVGATTRIVEPRTVAARTAQPVGMLYRPSKRAFDFFVGLALLIIATPIILVAAVIIRIETRGSPFFVQVRIGKHGKPFKIVKLRGMFIDARIRFANYYDYAANKDLDFCFHHEEDPRVTRAGRFIRKTSIDELPNLLNVVLGDMSLVGPRPEIPEVIGLYGAHRDEYLSVKPGVTCLSKITGRDRLTKRETIDYDIDYIHRRSFKLDLVILWRTLRSVMLRRDVF